MIVVVCREGEGWFCECASGYTGTLCERHGCDYAPCEHGGTCVRDGASYVCLCPYGRHGVTCSQGNDRSHPQHLVHDWWLACSRYVHSVMNGVLVHGYEAILGRGQPEMNFVINHTPAWCRIDRSIC